MDILLRVAKWGTRVGCPPNPPFLVGWVEVFNLYWPDLATNSTGWPTGLSNFFQFWKIFSNDFLNFFDGFRRTWDGLVRLGLPIRKKRGQPNPPLNGTGCIFWPTFAAWTRLGQPLSQIRGGPARFASLHTISYYIN